MGFVNCNRCSKLFDSTKDNLCPECKEIEAITIKKITDFLQSIQQSYKKSCSIKSISIATGVKVQEIERLYRLNKLRGFTGLFDLECKLCGEKFKPTVFSGVCCEKCSKKVEEVIQELKESAKYDKKPIIEEEKEITSYETSETKPASGMHVNDPNKTRCGFKKHN